jgi:hypothetical protein
MVRRRRQDGQTLVEFALVVPIFLLIAFGTFDVGFLVYSNSTLSQAAREGARVASAEAGWVGVPGHGCVSDASAIGPSNPGAHVCPPNVDALRDDIVAAVNRMTVGVGPVAAVYLSCNAGTEDDPVPTGAWTDGPGGDGNGCEDGSGGTVGSSGDLVSVRVEHTYGTFTPFLSSLIGSVPLSGSATMVIS